MGYWFDWQDSMQWVSYDQRPKPKRVKPDPARRELVPLLLNEFERGSSPQKLYAGLLLKTLMYGDGSLREDFWWLVKRAGVMLSAQEMRSWDSEDEDKMLSA